MSVPTVKPNLKIVGLHVEGFRALRNVNWPADGFGWGETVPDIVIVGGVNGSGKTTLLELIAEAAQELFLRRYRTSHSLPTAPTSIQFQMQIASIEQANFIWANGIEKLLERNSRLGMMHKYRQDVFGNLVNKEHLDKLTELFSTIEVPSVFAESDIPSVIYIPTDRRLVIPPESFKAAGKLAPHETFFYRFTAAQQWKDSLEAILYGARWADLNAKEEGHPERATHFKSYAEAFKAFFGDAKELTWFNGELFVKINDSGELHPLAELSSGEKQALILAAELYRRWRPGSLILIDEPELHFHASWQTALYTMLERWQKERGGQVIMATQSNHLFRIAPPDTTVLLKGPLA